MTISRPGLTSLVQSLTNPLERTWQQHRSWLLPIAIALLALLSALRLSEGFYRLIQEPGGMGAVDLKLRYHEVQGWFAGQPVYAQSSNTNYPPASYLLLGGLYFLPTEAAARLVWAIALAVALVVFALLVYRESGATDVTGKLFMILLFTASYDTSFGIGNGQLILFILPCLVLSLLLLKRFPTWGWRLVAIPLFVLTLVKPTLSAPFFWLALVLPSGFWVGSLIALLYVGLSLWSATYQQASLFSLLSQSVNNGVQVAVNQGYGNVNFWMSRLHLSSLALPASLLVLALLGLWVYRHRRIDVWVLIGVAAIVTRLWIYFFYYDDAIIFLALIALSRIVYTASPTQTAYRTVAALLLAADFILVVASKTLFSFLTLYLLDLIPTTLLPIYWIIVLVFLIGYASQQNRLAHSSPPLTKTG